MSPRLSHSYILVVRDASRRIVRELGFMHGALAGTDLSPSAVHAMIEIGSADTMTAKALGEILLLEKSSISRLLARLVADALVEETSSPQDGRVKLLRLTDDGRALLANIDRFANDRVGLALNFMAPAARAHAVDGLKAYAEALEIGHRSRGDEERPQIGITRGFQPGAIGRIVEMHGRYYAREWQFGAFFEARVSSGLAEFSARLENPVNGLWLAHYQGRIIGSAAVDGEDLGQGRAHLRWVIVDESQRGSGIGKRLITEAVRFCDAQRFAEIQLWTFEGLDAARRLYESFGFKLAEQWTGDQWGREVIEQRFVRKAG